MTETLQKIFTLRTVTLDILILAGIYFLPALSHLSPFPLYLLDPMRIFMLAGFLFSRQNTNGYLISLTIPVFSTLVTGHPLLLKAFVISIELVVNILLFIQLMKRTQLNTGLAVFLSIIGSKIVYYAIKSVFINFGFIEGALITTNVWMQFVTSVFISILFYVIWQKIRGQSRINE